VLYIKVLKDLIKVGGLRKAKNIAGAVMDNFYSKIKVIGNI
jgi:hypothetical protein